MYANFYKGNRLLFSVEVNSEKQAESLYDIEYPNTDDYSVTDKPLSKKILK